jgi:sigma-E factor negative regulatory protein RseB
MHPWNNVRLLLLLVSMSVWQCAFADPLLEEQADWLETMAFAAHLTDYSGTFVYQDGTGGNVQVSRITHVSDADGEHERLEGLNGSKREIISSNNQVWLLSGDRKVRIDKQHTEKTFPTLLPEQIVALKENYLVSQTEEDRVAGFHAHVVVFQPKDNLRYTHKMWAHSESGLFLKAVVLDEHARVIEQYAFTQLDIGGQVDRTWIEPNRAARYSIKINPPASAAKSITAIKHNDWQVDALPGGFKKIKEICRPIRDTNTPVTHLVFSDGLAAISVFIEDLGGRVGASTGLSSQGAIQIYSRVSGDKLITVVGEVPPRTVIQVADSVRYAGQ